MKSKKKKQNQKFEAEKSDVAQIYKSIKDDPTIINQIFGQVFEERRPVSKDKRKSRRSSAESYKQGHD